MVNHPYKKAGGHRRLPVFKKYSAIVYGTRKISGISYDCPPATEKMVSLVT
jgi:hypothetical protein